VDCVPDFGEYKDSKNCRSDVRPIIHSLFNQSEYPCFDAARVRQLCASLASQGGNSMARKVGQIIARGDRRWLIRVYLGRNDETDKPNYHNRTNHGSMQEAQAYLTRNLRERLAAIWKEQRLPSTNILSDGLRQPYDRECGRKPSWTTKACCGGTSGPFLVKFSPECDLLDLQVVVQFSNCTNTDLQSMYHQISE
jgi:hypothetical protein